MGGQAIDLSGGMVPSQPSVDLSAGLVPKSSATPPAQPEGFWHSLASQLGLTPEQLQAHANETLGQRVKEAALGPGGTLVKGLYDQAKQSATELGNAYMAPDLATATKHLVQAVPIVGPAINKAAEQTPADSRDSFGKRYLATITDPGTMGTLTGAAAQAAPIVAGAADSVLPADRPIIPTPGAGLPAAAKAYARPASSPAIVPPEEIQAQKIAQSILPPGGIKPELVKSIQAEAPAVVEYAQRTGNPLNTQAEGLKAAQGVAQEGLEHYQQQVLQPVAGRSVVLDSGSTELGDKATIGDIDSRITKLNKLVNTAPANSAGAALDVLAKSKWTDELGYLRNKLYSSLEQTTGIPAADIQQLREGYGGEYSLANNLEAAQNARLTRTGQAAQGQATIAGQVLTSLADVPMKGINLLRGGEQAISDRQFSSAMKGVKPQAPIRPVPPPIDTDAAAANRASAQQEFLRAQQGEQAAQDASVQRSQQAQSARMDNKATNASRWASEGYNNVVQHLGLDPSSGIARADLVKFAQTPQGNSLLTRASSLSPGSPAMRSLVQQIKTNLGASQ